MAKAEVGRTALGAATCRLIEQYEPEQTRLFSDPLVGALVGEPIRFLMKFASMRRLTVRQTDAFTPGIFGAQICRARAIDDAVRAALGQGVRQLVVLGAGLDTRAYRLFGGETLAAFEVDLPGVQKGKLQKVQKALGHLPKAVTFLPLDFDTQSLDAALKATAFDPAQPAVVVWEGVTQYITAAAVRQTLDFAGRLAPGSVLVFTYVLKSVIERRSGIPGAEKLVNFVANDSPWIFGLEPAELDAYLRPFHLTLTADLGAREYQERYLKPLGRSLVVSEIERVAQAVVA